MANNDNHKQNTIKFDSFKVINIYFQLNCFIIAYNCIDLNIIRV